MKNRDDRNNILSLQADIALLKAKIEFVEAFTSGIPLDRLEAICEAEKDGRCVVLPCKVGDTVYMIGSNSILTTKITEAYISPEISYSTFNINEHGVANYHSFYASKIGKSVFLAHEQAEAALKAKGEPK